MIGVMQDGNGIKTLLSGDELQVNTVIGNTLPKLYAEREMAALSKVTITPTADNSDTLKSLLIVITMVTAMFMGCTFNAMSIIGEKEDGIALINEVLPMTKKNMPFKNHFRVCGRCSIYALNCPHLYENHSQSSLAATAVNCSICFCGCVSRAVYRTLLKRAYGGNCIYQNCNDFVPRPTHSVLFAYPSRQHITRSVLLAPIKCDILRLDGLVKRNNARHWNRACRAVGTLPCMVAAVFYHQS